MYQEIILGLATLFVLAYFYFHSQWKYWTKIGVFQTKPTFPFGTLSAFFTKQEAFIDFAKRQGDEAGNRPFYGGYFLLSPVLFLKDVDLVKQVTVKDFDHFVDRNSSTMKEIFFGGKTRTDDIWRKQMTSAEGDEWKNIRATFTPIFTSGKMKAMMIFIQEGCGNLFNAFDQFASKNEEFELKECLGKFSMDTIASCAFGVDAQSFTNDKSQFVQYALNIFKQDFRQGLLAFLAFLPLGHKVMNAFGLSVLRVTETEFFYEAISASLKYRRESKTKRNDLVDMMLEAIKGELSEDHNEAEADQYEKDSKLNHKAEKHNMDELVVVATAIVILVAGYDTTGSTLAYACYYLAKHPEVQDKLRNEIEDIVGDDPDKMTKFSYDDIQQMHYLDAVISETLRCYTPFPNLQRTCTKTYQIPGTDIVIPKGGEVWINVASIHSDPKHYDSPLEFNPENFSKENMAKRNPYAFLPFGQGPRNCIGMRFALLEAKCALATVVKNFTLLPSGKTKEPIEIDPISAITYPKHGLYARVERRN